MPRAMPKSATLTVNDSSSLGEGNHTQDWPLPGPEPTYSGSSQTFRAMESNLSLHWADRKTEGQIEQDMPRTEAPFGQL